MFINKGFQHKGDPFDYAIGPSGQTKLNPQPILTNILRIITPKETSVDAYDIALIRLESSVKVSRKYNNSSF